MPDSDIEDGGMGKAGHHCDSSNVHVWGHNHDPPHCSGAPLAAFGCNRRGDGNSNRHGDLMDGKSCDADFHHHGGGDGTVSAHSFACDSAYLQSYDGRSAGTPAPLGCGDSVGHQSGRLLSRWSCPTPWLCGCPFRPQERGRVSGEGSQREHSDQLDYMETDS